MVEIAEKAFSVFSRFYQARQIERSFFSTGCFMLSSSFSATLGTPKARIANIIKKDKETYHLSLFNSMWRISLWLKISSCSITCRSGDLGYAHFSSRRNIISLWNLLRFFSYITRKARTESDFVNWFLKIFLNKIMYTLHYSTHRMRYQNQF